MASWEASVGKAGLEGLGHRHESCGQALGRENMASLAVGDPGP